MLKSIFFLVFIFSIQLVYGQLRIVKDNISCTYGLKSEDGKWLLEPTFILIEDLGVGLYKTTNEQGKGIYEKGKILIANHFDEITLDYRRYFQVRLGGKQGLYSLNGKLIAPAEFDYFTYDGDKRILAYKRDKEKEQTSVFSHFGELILTNIAGHIFPFSDKNYTYIADKAFDFNFGTGNVGIINHLGEEIIPRIYDRLLVCGDEIVFQKDGKIGKIDFYNKVILEAKHYLTPLGSYSNSYLACIKSEEIYQYTEEGLVFFIKGNGEFLPNHGIQQIHPIQISNGSSKAHYFFFKENKMGILAKDATITSPAIYDTLIPKPRINWINDYSKIARTNFLYKKNGKYGLLSHEGVELTEAIYDKFFRADYSKTPNYFFSKGLEVFYLNFDKDSIIPEKTKLICKSDSLYIFEINEEYFPFFTSQKSPNRISKLNLAYPGNKKQGQFFIVQEGNQSFVFDANWKAWQSKNLLYLDPSQGRKALYVDNKNNKGLFDLTDGKFILENIYDEINQAQWKQNILWAKKSNGTQKIYYADIKNNEQSSSTIFFPSGTDDQKYYEVPIYKWLIFDTLGNRKTKNTFDYQIWTTDTALVKEGTYYGVIDSNFEWIIPAKFQAIKMLSSTQFVIYTKTNKFGMLNEANKLIVDTVYTDFEEVFTINYPNYNYKGLLKNANEIVHLSLFKNEMDSLLVDNFRFKIDSKTQGNSAIIQSKLLKHAFQGLENHGQYAFKIHVHDSIKMHLFPEISSKSQEKIQKELYLFCKRIYKEDKPENFTNELLKAKNLETGYFDNGKRQISILDLGVNFTTVQTVISISNSFDKMPGPASYLRKNYNLIIKENKLFEINLDSIFTADLFQNEIILAIQKREDLKLDCSNPDLMAEKFRTQFRFCKEGIRFYYDEFGYDYNVVEILIPKERLSLHAKSKWLLTFLN